MVPAEVGIETGLLLNDMLLTVDKGNTQYLIYLFYLTSDWVVILGAVKL